MIAATGQDAGLLQCEEAGNTAKILGACGVQAAIGAAAGEEHETSLDCREGDVVS